MMFREKHSEKNRRDYKNTFPNGIRDDFIDTNRILKAYAGSAADKKISQDFIADVIRKNGIN